MPPAPPPAEVPEPAGSLPPAVLVPPRRSRQGHRVSTRAGRGWGAWAGGVGPAWGCCHHGGGRRSVGGCLLPPWWDWGPLPMGSPPLPSLSAEPATAWGTSEDSGGRAPGQDSHTEGGSVGQPAPAPFTSPPPSLLQPQHQFTSKTVRASSPPLTPGHAGGMQGGADQIPPRQVIRPEPCGACGSRLRFGKAALKCRRCQLLLHTKCRPCCPGPCGPRARQHAWPREVRAAQGPRGLGHDVGLGTGAVWVQHCPPLTLSSPGCPG